MFQCPNCRAWTDLSAEVDDTIEFEDELDEEANSDSAPNASDNNNSETNATNNDDTGATEELSLSHAETNETGADDNDLATAAENLRLGEDGSTPTQEADNPDGTATGHDGPVSGNSQSATIPIPNGPSRTNQVHSRSDTPANPETFEDDPMTPRNDTGPLALDGRAGHL